MSKIIKALLKEVRELIDQKKYDAAIEKCQNLLEEDPTNATAYLFLGAAYQNSDKEQAQICLRKAYKLSPSATSTTAIAALQGLSSCAPDTELPEIYGRLLTLLPNKYEEYHQKLLALTGKTSLIPVCVQLLMKEAEEEEQNERKVNALKILGKLWLTKTIDENASIPSSEQHDKFFGQAMEAIIGDNATPYLHLLASKRYMQYLYKRRDLNQCLRRACMTLEFYPQETSAYEYICKIYVENFELPGAIELWQHSLNEDIEHYAEKLMELNDDSGYSYLTKAIICYSKYRQLSAARDYTYKMLEMQANNSIALKLLALIHMEFEAYEYALRFFQKLELLDTKEYAICLSHSKNEDKLKEAIKLLLNQADMQNKEIVATLARCYHKLGDLEKLNELQLNDITRAELLMSPSQAIEFLNDLSKQQKLNFAALFLLGKRQIELGMYAECWQNLKVAVGMKPHSSQCFFLLGKMYEMIGDLTSAQKTFVKCLSLNPVCEQAIYNLSNIYFQTEQYEQNVNMLLSSSQHLLPECSEKVHYLLSMQYLKMQSYDKAVTSIRTALLSSRLNCLYWEVLGDALSERGSYQSAIKMYTRILEIDATHMFAKLKIALLKLTTRNYVEAIEDFDKFLQEHPDCEAALKGAAEAHMGLSQNLKKEYRYVRCKQHLQMAAEYAQQAFFRLNNHKMVWPWQLLVEIFMQTACLPESLANLQVSGKLTHQSSDTLLLNREELYNVAIMFIKCALKLQRQNMFLWYDLARCYYYNALNNSVKASSVLISAYNACRMALQISNNWQNWSLLGAICMHKDVNKLELAQHCFIKAVHLDRKSYIAWTNLGSFYLYISEIKLANKSFQRAQQSNPMFGNCWIGQAMVAEALGDEEETLDLFRHCQQFEYHPEAMLGYAHWVCQLLTNEHLGALPHHKHATKNMHANAVALDAINRYVSNEECAASLAGLTIQAFLFVQAELYRPALKAYLSALSKAKDDNDDGVCNEIITNIGYLYVKINEPQKAIESFNTVTETTFTAMIGLALAYAQAEESHNAYMTFNAIINNIGQDDARTGKIYVAMAAMLYQSEQVNDAKNILLNCILQLNPPIEAVYSAFALGILAQNFEILDTIALTMKEFERNFTYCATIAFLQAQFYVLKQEKTAALKYIAALLRTFPHCRPLRQVMATFLLTHFGRDVKYQMATIQLAKSTVTKVHPKIVKTGGCIDDSNALFLASQALESVDKLNSVKLLQKAIHLYPENLKAWQALI